MPSLEIKTKQSLNRLELTDHPVTIGRSPENTLVLPDSRASRVHCIVEDIDGHWCVRDMESRNGTTLNGEPLKVIERLNNGDVIKIGRAKIHFIDPEAAHLGRLAEVEEDETALDDLFPVDVGTVDFDLNDMVTEDSARARWETKLQEIIDNGTDRGFSEREIDVLDARGIGSKPNIIFQV